MLGLKRDKKLHNPLFFALLACHAPFLSLHQAKDR